ncbi:MAG: helix-hairpin-helix domain-containing protein [Ignavibacteriaceae bacterium]
MKLNTVLTIILFLILIESPYSQSDTTYLSIDDMLEKLIEEVSEESDNAELFDRFEYLINNPIDINNAGLTELLNLPLIDIHSANLIIDHRNKFGSFFSVHELFAIRDLPKDKIENILPFVTVIRKQIPDISEPPRDRLPVPNLSDIRINLRSRTTNDLQSRRGFIENRYAGSKIKSYNRLLVKQNNNYQIGILTEKDPGEKSYMDFASYHLMIRDIGFIKTAVLGDYLLEFGQGLALWSPYPISKSSDAIFPATKNSRGLRPYTSSTEVNFLRGGATSIQYDNLIFTAFYSQNKFDASIDSTIGTITSRPLDGYHRTENEINRINSAEEKIFGGVVQYNPVTSVHIGILAYKVNLSHPIQSSTGMGLNGDDFSYISSFYNLVLDDLNFFGEITYDQTSVASINGLQFSVTRNFSLITTFRNYPGNYSNYKGSGFGERAGATNNEVGFYTGFRWRTPIGILNFYYDQFKFPYRTFTNVSPSDGDEVLSELTSKPFTNVETKMRFKYENKDVSQTLEDLRQVTKRLRQSVRFEVSHIPSKNIRLRSRAEYNYFRINSSGIKEDGYLFFQDVRYTPLNELVLYGRMIFFKTDSFNSAVYEYENDLTGVMTNLAMYGEGLRWYFLVRYKVLRFLTLSLKYSETYKPKEETLSSGNNLIPDNLDNRISFQVDMNF